MDTNEQILYDELVKIAGLVSTAAAKHTGASVEARAGNALDDRLKRRLDTNAVGRLHNAAKRAREVLEAGACRMCADAHEAGVDAMDRAGTCAECGRGLGPQIDTRNTRVVQRRTDR